MFIRLMQSEQMKLLVPSFTREVPLEHWRGREPDKDSVCVELGDLTAAFGECPCVMDIKVGVRTFLEDEVSNPKVREDLLKKMDKLDGTAATAEEREKVRRGRGPSHWTLLAPPHRGLTGCRPRAASQGGITKLRYMQFRERMSTSSTLGYRVEGVHVARAISSRDSAGSGGPIPPHRMESEAMSKETLSKISTEAVRRITSATRRGLTPAGLLRTHARRTTARQPTLPPALAVATAGGGGAAGPLHQRQQGAQGAVPRAAQGDARLPRELRPLLGPSVHQHVAPLCARRERPTPRRPSLPPAPLPPPPSPAPALSPSVSRAPPPQARLQRCGVWMIDFSKARPSSQPLTHTKAWELGNQEDGYLWGLANLIRAWEALL